MSESERAAYAELITKYQEMLGFVALLTHKHPRVLDLRLAVTEDCQDKHPQLSFGDAVTFCYCAGVVTTAMWMMFPEEKERIRQYTAGEITSPEPFLNRQGPELYAPMCEVVHVAEKASN